MADKIRSRLERLVPQGLAWEKAKLYTFEEVATIMKRRKAFEETLLTNRYELGTVKEYGEFEANVYELTQRKMRMKRRRDSDLSFSLMCTAPSLAAIGSLFLRAEKRHGTEPVVYKLEADIYMRCGQYEEAADAFTKACAIIPNNRELWHLYAMAASLSPRHSQSQVLARCLALFPDDVEALKMFIIFEVSSAIRMQEAGREAADGATDQGELNKNVLECSLAVAAVEEFIAKNPNSPAIQEVITHFKTKMAEAGMSADVQAIVSGRLDELSCK